MVPPENMIDPPGLDVERSHWFEKRTVIGGVDEAGRGALAGPIVAGLVVLPPLNSLPDLLSGVYDSKKMKPNDRAFWAEKIKDVAAFWAIGVVSSQEIDQIGLQPANQLAMTRAIEAAERKADFYLFDFIHWKKCPYPGQRYKKGESVSLSIAAASVLAKTARDEMMIQFDAEYPHYCFRKHKGYGTLIHRNAIHQWGYCPIHRATFTLK
jgi:ribonuclease HII